jgi:poly-gamma-glutamate synthesis protein (capsule biosynthesis protein)
MCRDDRPPITLWLSGDVMTGRGIDQVLPHPCDPILYEPCMTSAEGYVELAERASGSIPRPVDFAYPWGDALDELERVGPDVRIVNLETAVTRSADAWRSKAIHYRTSPQNARVLAAAGIHCCALANNHVLDWGYAGLAETLDTLDSLGVRHAGAGRTLAEAETPATLDLGGKGRVLVYSFAATSSGVPRSWEAAGARPGVALLRDLSEPSARRIAERVASEKRAGDVVVVSLHWGDNWGFDVPPEQRDFAHALVELAGADVVHGHSSHHVKGIEVHRQRPILYGCGDFLDDYEGIGGFEQFRDDLGLMYFVALDAKTGDLVRLEMTPTRIAGLRVRRACGSDALWLAETLRREGERFGTSVVWTGGGRLDLRWRATAIHASLP